ncbi:hypothetical protein CPB86DRAFT_212982 [Serendipita vermifera]|nr:hypothetical protein CPB86DRAFT_212982 [Serendipita vermifera]
MRLDSSLDAAITDDHKAIIAAQTEIIDSIVNLEKAIGTGDGKNRSAFLQDHKVAYNTLTDQVLKRQNRLPRFDPLQKLPPELWIRIISLVLSSYWPPPAFFPDSIDVDAVLPLTLVSKWWQQALLGVAQFWTHISVDTRHPDSVAKAVMCFELSANLPISFDVVQRSRIEWNTIGPHILRNKHRIHQLHIRSYERDDEADYIAELDVLMLLLPLPNLRRMVSMWDTDHDDLKRILHACPSLQDMALRNLTERFNDVNLNVFVKAEVYLSEIALLLEKNPPSIRSVRVSSNNPQDHLESLLGMPSLNGSDLGWQSLDWSNVLYPIPTKLLRRLVNLTSLTIDTTFTVIGELFNHLHDLPRLISLTIIIQVVLYIRFIEFGSYHRRSSSMSHHSTISYS